MKALTNTAVASTRVTSNRALLDTHQGAAGLRCENVIRVPRTATNGDVVYDAFVASEGTQEKIESLRLNPSVGGQVVVNVEFTKTNDTAYAACGGGVVSERFPVVDINEIGVSQGR